MQNKSFKISLDTTLSGHRVKKSICPNCGKKRFARYIYLNSGQYLPSQYGRCDREESCGYWLKPEKSFYHEEGYSGFNSFTQSDIDETTRDFHNNNFVKFLASKFNPSKVMNVIDLYRVGTLANSTVFWQIDSNGFARTGKVIPYNPETGKRNVGTNWMHTLKGFTDFTLMTCFFGEHLIKPNHKIGIVESEKTAIIAKLFYPELTWIATGSKNGLGGERSGLNLEKCEVLEGHDIVLFPDLSKQDSKHIPCFALWSKMAEELKENLSCSVVVYDQIENEATPEQKEAQLDLADFILMDIEKKNTAKA